MSSDLAPTTGVAGRYATALFDLAQESGAADAIEAELKSLSAAIDGSSDLKSFIASPVYSREDQVNAIVAIAKDAKLSEMTANFLTLVTHNGRLFALPSIIAAFQALAADARGEISAEVTSAAALNDEQLKALRLEIETMAGKAVNLRAKTDPDLLGGLIVKIGSKMIDSSLRTKLNRLKTVMKEA